MNDISNKDDLFGDEPVNRGSGDQFLIVGIGASAGGIHALKEFFAHVPADSGIAYVVILHLSPDHESKLAEVLQATATIPVTQVQERVKVEPNHVYVISPNQSLAITDGHLALSEVTRIGERTRELESTNEALRAEISERVQAERLRVRLLRQIVRAQEDERRRVARDIHDQLGQQMTALRLKLEAVKEMCREQEELCEQLDQTQSLAEDLDRSVDFLAWELRPAALDDLGLEAAVSDFVKEWSKYSGVQAEFHTSGLGKERLAPETETNLYRITQEALNNTMKHARAKRANVLLERRDSQIVLIVEDDGAGFDVQSMDEDNRRLGLTGMRERAIQIGGSVEIESKPQEGTTIFARVPARVPASLEGEEE